MTLLIVLLLFSCTEKAETNTDGENKSSESTTIDESGKKSFEGYITYKINFVSNNEEPISPQLKTMFGDSLKIYFSDKGYIMNYLGGRLDAVVYLGDLRQYTKFKQADSLEYRDIGKEPSNLYSILENKTDKVVLGRKLNSIDIITSNYEKHYYFDPNMYMNPKYFENHIFGYENRYYDMAKAPYLYAEVVYPNMTVILEAIDIVQMELPDAIYELPKMPLKKIER